MMLGCCWGGGNSFEHMVCGSAYPLPHIDFLANGNDRIKDIKSLTIKSWNKTHPKMISFALPNTKYPFPC